MLEQPASMAETATAKTFERTDMTDLSRLQDFNIQKAIGGELKKTKGLPFFETIKRLLTLRLLYLRIRSSAFTELTHACTPPSVSR
jgi:hypothetical protein